MNVLVVGGSSGLGAEISSMCHKKKHRVMTLQRRRPASTNVYSNYRYLDLRGDFDSVKKIAYETAQDHKTDWLVLSGGIGAFTYPLMKASQLEEQYATNVRGPIAVFQGCYKAWVARKEWKDGRRFRVLYIGSSCDRNRAPGVEVYAATKAMASKYFVEIGGRYIKHGVRSNVLVAGWFASPMTQAIIDADKENQKDVGMWDRIIRNIPLRREGKVTEIAEMAYSVLSGPDYLTGNRIEITGGI